MINKLFSHIGVFFLHLLSYLPWTVLFLIADFIYFIVYRLVKYRRIVTRNNLINSYPEKSLKEIIKIEKDYYHYLADLVMEIVKMSSITQKQLLKRTKMNNFDLVEAHLAKGESVLASASHYGNWENTMMAMGLNLSAPCYVIYKPVNNKVFEKWFNNFRTKFGNKFIPMKQTAREIVATKNETNLFFFASDQSPRRDENHHIIKFLNQDTSVLVGLEKIAKQTNRPIYYFDFNRIGRGRYEINCIPLCLRPKETETYEITNLYFKQLTKSLDRNPAYWLWSHNRWKANH